MFPPHHYGGYELSCRDVVDRWRARGHEVTVLTSTMRVQGVADPPDERKGQVWRQLEISYREGDLYTPPLWQRRSIEKTNQAALADAMASIRPDVVSVWHMGAMSIGLITSLVRFAVPLVYVICDDWPTYAHKIDPWMKLWYRWPKVGRRVEHLAGVPTTLPDIGRSGTFCFISTNTRDRCLKYSPWLYPDSTVTYNGIDHAEFPVVDRPPDHPWRWRLVNAGRLDPRKGLDTAVRALAYLPSEATLEVLPSVDDPYRAKLQQVADQAGVGDRLRFRIITRSQLRSAYSEADVCVFPTEWDEPFGLVPLEAMACGTPVVATGSGGSGEFLFDGDNCLRFPEKDPGGLAAAIRRLAEDPDLRKRLVDGGLRTAQELGVDQLTDVLERWHLAAADRFAGGRPRHRLLAIL
jgi:glycosyltransferase involved in cell wall biosynthesis